MARTRNAAATTKNETESQTENQEVAAKNEAETEGREVKTSTGLYTIRPFSEIPPRSQREGALPFDKLAEGQCFFVPADDEKKAKAATKRLSTVASTQGQKLGKKFAARTIHDEEGQFGEKDKHGTAIYCVSLD